MGIANSYENNVVGDPNLVEHIGMVLSTGRSKYIHEDVTDIDLAALYPSITRALNISPETHAGQIKYLDENGEDDTVRFIDKYNSNDSISFGIEFMGLPSVEQLISVIEAGDNDE